MLECPIIEAMIATCPHCHSQVHVAEPVMPRTAAPLPDKQVRSGIKSLTVLCWIAILISSVSVVFHAVNEYRYQHAVDYAMEALEKFQGELFKNQQR